MRSQTSSRVGSRRASRERPSVLAPWPYSLILRRPQRRQCADFLSVCAAEESGGDGRGRTRRRTEWPIALYAIHRAIPARESARFEYGHGARGAVGVCMGGGGGPCLMAGTARLARVSRPHALGLPSHPAHTHSDRAACDERGRTRPPRVAARTVTTPRFRRLTVSKKEATFCRLSCSRPRPLRHTALLG